jgi:hypothetical protein
VPLEKFMPQDMVLFSADGTVPFIRLTLYTEVNNLKAYFALCFRLSRSNLKINMKLKILNDKL